MSSLDDTNLLRSIDAKLDHLQLTQHIGSVRPERDAWRQTADSPSPPPEPEDLPPVPFRGDLAGVVRSIEARLWLWDAATVDDVADALLDARLGVEGRDSDEQRQLTRERAAVFLDKLRAQRTGKP